jgi:hypothetical protein
MHAPLALSPPGRVRGLLSLTSRWLAELAMRCCRQRGSIRGQLMFVVVLIAFGLAYKAGLLDGLMHPVARP